jgi:hypothetical protein
VVQKITTPFKQASQSVRVVFLQLQSPLSSRRARFAAWGDMTRSRTDGTTEGKQVSFWSGKSLIIVVSQTADPRRFESGKNSVVVQCTSAVASFILSSRAFY